MGSERRNADQSLENYKNSKNEWKSVIFYRGTVDILRYLEKIKLGFPPLPDARRIGHKTVIFSEKCENFRFSDPSFELLYGPRIIILFFQDFLVCLPCLMRNWCFYLHFSILHKFSKNCLHFAPTVPC